MKQPKDVKAKLTEALKGVASSVTTQDKRDAADQYKVHYNTVNNYIRGEVSDIELGLHLLEFFNGRITERISRVRRILAA